MTQRPPTQQQPERREARVNPTVQQAQRGGQAAADINASVAALRTEADRARGLFGLGTRILVPPDEIHVAVGDGRHPWVAANERKVYGQSADRPARYWLNRLTQVIKLKTISFTIPIQGYNNEGVQALDASKVSFRLWAHAVAKLDPEKAEIAAQRVGLDTTGLINTITEVGTAELVAAAATMSLEEIIANRQRLAEIAFPKVNEILAELGYDLALLTVTQLDGMAYGKLVEQAESRISKETSIATNREQVAEMQDDQSRARTEAEIAAATEKKLAAERLEAAREVETAELNQQESIAVRRHELDINQKARAKTAAEAKYETDLAAVNLSRELGLAEATSEADIARQRAEREAELKAIQQKRGAAIRLAEAEADAERLAVEQAREIERRAERTAAEAERLEREELAAAERLKAIAVMEANQLAESLEIDASARARALSLQVDAETKADMVRAETEATATQKRAEAAKVRAEATRAEAAAPGLAEAEVAKAQVLVAERQVDVTRAEGLAEAEVARAQAEAEAERLQKLKDVDIEAQRKLAALYEKAPVLIELEKQRMAYTHEERLMQMQMDAYLKAFEALAPGVRVNIIGNGSQTSQLMADLMGVARGVTLIGEEVPIVGQLVNGRPSNGTSADLPLLQRFTAFAPYLQQLVAETNPRVFSALKVADVVERLVPVVAGEGDLSSALDGLRQDANFRVIGDLPVGPLLQMLGVNLLPESGEASTDEDMILDGKSK